jgi:hypothetical protein
MMAFTHHSHHQFTGLHHVRSKDHDEVRRLVCCLCFGHHCRGPSASVWPMRRVRILRSMFLVWCYLTKARSGWTGPKTCVSGACCVYSNEWYSQCLACTGGGTSSPTTTLKTTTKATTTAKSSSTTKASSTTIKAPTGVTTTLPASSGAVATNKAIPVSGSFDGGMKKYDRSRGSHYPRSCSML